MSQALRSEQPAAKPMRRALLQAHQFVSPVIPGNSSGILYIMQGIGPCD